VAVTLLPLRLVLTFVNVPLALIVAQIATLGLREADYDPLDGSPLNAWRRAIFSLVSLLVRFQLLLFGFWRIRVKGRCASREEAPIIVANHVSGLVEGMFMIQYAKLAERSYATNPVLAPFMLATSCIFVDRKDPDSRSVAKRALLRRCVDNRFPQTLVFPEGTCTNGTALVQFKVGAFAPGAAVQPVCFRYPKGSHDPSFTFPLGTAGYVLGLLLQVANHMEVEYLPVYRPSDAEAKSPALYATGVQQAIAVALGVPTTKHAAEDVALCIAAKRMKMPLEAGTVLWQAVSESLTGLHVKEAIKVMEQFRSLDKEGAGRIDFQTFAAGVRDQTSRRISAGEIGREASAQGGGCAASLLTEEDLLGIFELMDKDSNGCIDFHEYLCGVAVLNGRGDEEQGASLKWMFESLAHGKSHFNKAQLDDLLCRAVPNLDSGRLDVLFRDADANRDGLVSREEFINFAIRHREDIGLNAQKLLRGLPMSLDNARSGP